MSLQLAEFLQGAMCMGSVIAGLFFLRFWRDTADRLFVFFAAAFLMEAVSRAVLALGADPREGDPQLYLLRCVAYGMILVGIIDKNRRA
ncbi:MAG: DUF5985 family protein [Candidatus Sumerlaeaceae bacterium]